MNKIYFFAFLLSTFLFQSASWAGWQTGCTAESCREYYVSDGYQLGCWADKCETFYISSGYQLGCWQTGCDDFYVSKGWMLGCWQTGCDDFYVSAGWGLVCSQRGCETRYGVPHNNMRSPARYSPWQTLQNRCLRSLINLDYTWKTKPGVFIFPFVFPRGVVASAPTSKPVPTRKILRRSVDSAFQSSAVCFRTRSYGQIEKARFRPRRGVPNRIGSPLTPTASEIWFMTGDPRIAMVTS